MSPSLSPLQEIAQPILIRKLAVLVVFATSLIEPIFAFIAKQQHIVALLLEMSQTCAESITAIAAQ